MTVPQPRPALIRGADGTVRHARPHASSLVVETGTELTKKAKKKAKKGDEMVELVVQLPKRDRKRLRRKATQYGWTAEEAAAHVIRVWADSP